MKLQLDNYSNISFLYWWDHTLLKEGEAFTNTSSNFYLTKDDTLGGFNSFSSPHKQWIVDESISGVSIPSGLYVNDVFTSFNDTDFIPDWNNGRVITNLPANTIISGEYSVKEINSYINNFSEEELILENKYEINPKWDLPARGAKPHEMYAPACFVNISPTTSEPYQMGGSNFQKEDLRFRVVFITDKFFQIDAVSSIARRQNDKCFPLLTEADEPFTWFGSLKSQYSGSYSYENFLNEGRDLFFIEKVNTSKLNTRSADLISKNLQILFINFDVSYYRKN